eukprot:scaffold21963_cov71-Phaeocystis_antarctica.AAC.1
MVEPIGKTSPTPGTPAPAEATTTLSTENIILKASRSQIEQRIAAGCPSLGMRAVTPLAPREHKSPRHRSFPHHRGGYLVRREPDL